MPNTEILTWESKTATFDTTCWNCASHIAKGDKIALLTLPYKTIYVFGPCCEQRTQKYTEPSALVSKEKWLSVIAVTAKGAASEAQLEMMWQSFVRIYVDGGLEEWKAQMAAAMGKESPPVRHGVGCECTACLKKEPTTK